MKIDEAFGEIDKICYILEFEILNPKISNLRSLTLNPRVNYLNPKSLIITGLGLRKFILRFRILNPKSPNEFLTLNKAPGG